MDRQEITWNIRNQNFIARSLWCVFEDPGARDGMAIKFGMWEGPGEYRAIEFPHKGRVYYINTLTFRKLRLTCQNCGGDLRDDNNFLKPVEKDDVFICDNCGSSYNSIFGSPLKEIKNT